MKYLVLRPFRSFGVTLCKGDIVDEEQIRSPYLRRSEGKIVPAVSSAKVPEEVSVEAETSVPPTVEDDNKEEGAQGEQDEKFAVVDETNEPTVAATPLFSFTAPSN